MIKAIEDAQNVDGKSKGLDEDLLAEVFNADTAAEDVDDDLRTDGVIDLAALGNRMANASGSSFGSRVLSEDVQAALLKSGVQYSHNNQALVGNSKLEEFITQQAVKLHGEGGPIDIDNLPDALLARVGVFPGASRVHAPFRHGIPSFSNFPSGLNSLTAPSFVNPYVPTGFGAGLMNWDRYPPPPPMRPPSLRPPLASSLSTAQMTSRLKPTPSITPIEISEDDTPSPAILAAQERFRREHRSLTQPLKPTIFPVTDLKISKTADGTDFIDLVDD